MSVEMHVFFRGKLPNKRELSRAMGDLGFPLSIAAGSLEKQRGFMPMKLRREETGVEFDVFEGRAAVEEIGGEGVDPAFERSANFRWGGDEDEMLAGLCAAAALAKLVHGIVFETEAGELLTVDEAIALARETLHRTLKPEDAQRRGNRPGDIKRYLKPLLKQRSDLVLIGPLLVIRPVRHILRGAMIKPWHKTHIAVHNCLNLLCHPFGINGYDGYISKGGWPAWEPHLEPLLMDCLAEDIFESVGRVTTLEAFAAELPDQDWLPVFRLTALLLSGARDEAAAYVQQIESAKRGIVGEKRWAAQRDRLTWDVAKLCDTFHAHEAECVKALKLESIWEPSPFPVEVPKSERKRRADEPTFTPRPWIARPNWLLEDAPEWPGDVRFAKNWLSRNGKVILSGPLSREEAEDRHRHYEKYALAVRLPEGLLLLDWMGTDRFDPGRVAKKSWLNLSRLSVQLYGSDFVVRASFFTDLEIEGRLHLTSGDVRRQTARWPNWSWSIGWEQGVKRIWDRRSGELVFAMEPLTEGEREELKPLRPRFGEFEAVARIVGNFLRSGGYGEIK